MTEKCNWPLGNGKVLEFEIYDRNEGWNDVPGLYIFSYQANNMWYALYVGQAKSFNNRLPNHERLDEAIRKGTTHIHTLIVHQQSNRDKWESMYIQHLQPPMNVHHREPLPV